MDLTDVGSTAPMDNVHRVSVGVDTLLLKNEKCVLISFSTRV